MISFVSEDLFNIKYKETEYETKFPFIKQVNDTQTIKIIEKLYSDVKKVEGNEDKKINNNDDSEEKKNKNFYYDEENYKKIYEENAYFALYKNEERNPFKYN